MTMKHVAPKYIASKYIASLALAAVLAFGTAAHAKTGDQDSRDIAALDGMKITLQQAIVTAEQQAGGRAVSADVKQENGGTRIAVEVVGTGGVKTVLVDARSGAVTAAHGADGDDDDDD